MKGVLRLEENKNLRPNSFMILSRVGEVNYRLALPPSLSIVHPLFHIFVLQNYVLDKYHMISRY